MSDSKAPAARALWQAARQVGLPAALWRLPDQAEQQMLVCFERTLPRVTADLEALPAGFLMSAFDNRQLAHQPADQALFLRADVQAVFSSPTTPLVIQQTPGSQVHPNSGLFWRSVEKGHTVRCGTGTHSVRVVDDADQQSHFEQMVRLATAATQRGALQKVVVSRIKQLRFSQPPDELALFDRLCQTDPSSFVSLVFLPERGQLWLGATPERLVSLQTNHLFKTLALAGTQPLFHPDGQAKQPARTLWSQKEIEEQALVSRFIVGCFKQLRLREYLEEGPKTVIAGHMMHLATTFTVDTNAVAIPNVGTQMLGLLHPTSAVCGSPREIAYRFIRQHEAHSREFYSGFLGPLKSQSQPTSSDLFVNLRCMKLEGELGTLYAGAGLTGDSVAQAEWQETELKCQTLLTVIKQLYSCSW